MSLDLDEKISLSAHVTKEPRGTGMLNIFLTMNRLGYPKHARVNTVGGLTYVVTRNGNTAPSAPTLLLNDDEAQILATALFNYLYGPGWDASPARVQEMREELETLRKEHSAMRKGKKSVEDELQTAMATVDHLREIDARYRDLMAIVKAVNLGVQVTDGNRDYCN